MSTPFCLVDKYWSESSSGEKEGVSIMLLEASNEFELTTSFKDGHHTSDSVINLTSKELVEMRDRLNHVIESYNCEDE